jgi:hypothetical protein
VTLSRRRKDMEVDTGIQKFITETDWPMRTVRCTTCGTVVYIPQSDYEAAQNSAGNVWCPNGHATPLNYKSDNVPYLTAKLSSAYDNIHTLESQVRALKGQITKLKRGKRR